MLRYPVKLTPDDNGTILVTAPDLPEVSTFGEDTADALRRAADAIATALQGRIRAGEKTSCSVGPPPWPAAGGASSYCRREAQTTPPHTSDTKAPPWRSMRPASSSSSSTVRTIAAEAPESRMRSSVGTGVGPSRSMIRSRSPASGSPRGAHGNSGSRTGSSIGCPIMGRRIVITSSAWVTKVAPCLSRSAAFGAGIERGAGHSEDFAPLLEREPRGDERA